MSSQTAEYDLFLDESGDFRETSTELAELQASNRQDRPFPSQIAGILARRGAVTKGEARKLLYSALGAAGLPAGPVHANALPGYAREEFFLALTAGLRERGWQPVRVANWERVRYGDRVTTYTSLVAELVVRACEQLALAGERSVSVRLVCARVVVGEDTGGTLLFIDRDEYRRRVQEYLGFAAVRRGLARQSAAWQLDSVRLGGAKDDPDLQLADAVSYASHADFRPCGDRARAELRAAFGAYDFTLSVWELGERVDRLLADDFLGAAVQALAEGLAVDGLAEEARAAAAERLRSVVARLARVGAPVRDPHLAGVVNWLEQTIDLQRSLEIGARVTRWLQAEVLVPLRAALPAAEEGSLDWFAFALHTWALTAANHRGALGDARREVDGQAALLPALVGQWDHAPLLMRGLVAEAVHRTDCFEFAEAARRMEVVADYYGSLGTLFGAALPGAPAGRVRSDLCGRALGTWLQAEHYAALLDGDPARVDRARRVSDRAIDEFPAVADRERQYQYRAQLETAAGRFADARSWLARSLRLDDDTHAALAAGIRTLADASPVAQGFALLHWLRLGATALLDGDRTEGDAFLAAAQAAGVLDWAWCRGEQGGEYPAHGILRRVAVVRAFRGEPAHAADSLTRLADVLRRGTGEQAILSVIRLAAHAEAAAVLGSGRAKAVRQLLEGTGPDYPGLLQQLEGLRSATETSLPRLWSVIEPWSAAARRLRDGDATAGPDLLRLARQIGY